ncbi:hypothetical protein LTR06_011239 [Exophiala xenobiotica]|nr:hypothetical protein LTR06_011239 [Exophiala xenobiotica]
MSGSTGHKEDLSFRKPVGLCLGSAPHIDPKLFTGESSRLPKWERFCNRVTRLRSSDGWCWAIREEWGRCMSQDRSTVLSSEPDATCDPSRENTTLKVFASRVKKAAIHAPLSVTPCTQHEDDLCG